MELLGKALLGVAALLVVVGVTLLLLHRFGVGRLPGDLVIRRDNFTLYAPFGLMLLVSILGTLALNLLFRRR